MATLDFSIKDVGGYTWLTCNVCADLLVLDERLPDQDAERARLSRWVSHHLGHVYNEDTT